MLTRQYVYFFAKCREFFSFFGELVACYTLVVFGMSGLLVVFNSTASVDTPLAARTLMIIFFVLMHCVGLSTTVSAHLTVAHIEYLVYLGFTDRQTHLLACVIAAPMCLAGSIFVFVVMTGGLPLSWRFGLLLATFVLGESASPVSLWLRKRWGIRRKRRQRKSIRYSSVVRAFRGPYRAFAQKDLRELRSPNGILLIISLIMVDFVIMLFSAIGSSGWGFGICLSLSLLFTSTAFVATLFEYECKAYRYYTRQLRLKDEQIIAFKLPLQFFVVVCTAIVLTVFAVLVYGFTFHNLLLAGGMTAYYAASCVPLGWWHTRRLKKSKSFNSLFAIATLAFFAFPGTVLLYTVVSALARRPSSNSQVKRFS
jgi:hypothetical protein